MSGGTVETIDGYNIIDDDDTTDAEDLFETYTNVKSRYDKNKTKDNFNMVKNILTGNIVGVLTGAYKMSKNKKEYENYVKGFKDTALELGIPEYSPHTDTIVQTLEQELIDINKTRDKDEDKKDDDSPPVIEANNCCYRNY
jgi:preprotein translocase subunit Sec63